VPRSMEDPVTGVTLVSPTAPTPAGGDATAHLDAVHGILARGAAAELLAGMAAGGPQTP
jgi:hypothetical protein